MVTSGAHVQAIKRQRGLLELCGPLFMSYPVSSNLQYRLSEEAGGPSIKFQHLALGLIEEDHRKGVVVGWQVQYSRSCEGDGRRGPFEIQLGSVKEASYFNGL